jgi:hypothetical protein
MNLGRWKLSPSRQGEQPNIRSYVQDRQNWPFDRRNSIAIVKKNAAKLVLLSDPLAFWKRKGYPRTRDPNRAKAWAANIIHSEICPCQAILQRRFDVADHSIPLAYPFPPVVPEITTLPALQRLFISVRGHLCQA